MTTTRWYDFRFNGNPAGWFEIHESRGEIAMNAVFSMDGKVWENPFGVRHTDRSVLAYRCTPDTWIPFAHGPDRYPTSAYPLLVPQVRERLKYFAVNEGSGKEEGETELTRDGDMVIERRGGREIRRFRLDAHCAIIWINWGGGATSTLKANEAEAKARISFTL